MVCMVCLFCVANKCFVRGVHFCKKLQMMLAIFGIDTPAFSDIPQKENRSIILRVEIEQKPKGKGKQTTLLVDCWLPSLVHVL